MTELARVAAQRVAEEFDLPRLAVAARQLSTDGTREVSLPAARRRGDRDRRDSRRRSHDAVHLVAGGVRAAVRVLRDRRDGLQPQPHRVRDRRSGARDAPARPADQRHEHRVHGHGRAAHELEGGRRRRSTHPQRSRRRSASARATSRSRRSACCRASSRSASDRSSSVSRSRSTRRTTGCVAS